MTWLGYIPAGIACLLVVAAVIVFGYSFWLNYREFLHEEITARRISVVVDDPTDDDEPLGYWIEVHPSGWPHRRIPTPEPVTPGYSATWVPWKGSGPVPPMPTTEPLDVDPQPTMREQHVLGDTLVEVGAHLVHIRCRNARRDNRPVDGCCAERLGARLW